MQDHAGGECCACIMVQVYYSDRICCCQQSIYSVDLVCSVRPRELFASLCCPLHRLVRVDRLSGHGGNRRPFHVHRWVETGMPRTDGMASMDGIDGWIDGRA